MASNQRLRLIRIDYLGALRVHGADAARFLQGQLSSDVLALPDGRMQLAGYHSPQGRALAVLRLVRIAPDDILAVLPRELAGPLAERLRRYVLRAKAKIEDASAQWTVAGLVDDGPAQDALPPAAATLPGGLHEVRTLEGHVVACVGASPRRWLVLSPADTTPGFAAGAVPDGADAWRALDIAAGLPQVYAATSEGFVAQMLNLDVLGGVAFDKGCYTGQEVIARAHYRGRVKRRMQRFRTLAPARLVPGETGTLGDGRTFRVVEAVTRADGRSEFLAVAAFGATAASDDGTEPAAGAGTPQHAGPAALECETLALPYALPE